jgi:hypothetical protein
MHAALGYCMVNPSPAEPGDEPGDVRLSWSKALDIASVLDFRPC